MQLFDTIANSFLISHCALDPSSPTSPIGLIVSSSCTYLAPLTFPAPVLAALTVGRLGRSTVEWRIALWPAKAATAQDDGSASRYGTPGVLDRSGAGEVRSTHRIVGPCAAYGTFTHVFVDPSTRKSVELAPQTRRGLELLSTGRSG